MTSFMSNCSIRFYSNYCHYFFSQVKAVKKGDGPKSELIEALKGITQFHTAQEVSPIHQQPVRRERTQSADKRDPEIPRKRQSPNNPQNGAFRAASIPKGTETQSPQTERQSARLRKQQVLADVGRLFA